MAINQNFLIFSELSHSEMVFVKGGSFRMGNDGKEAYDDENPVHSVIIPDFYIGKYPVTQAIWQEVMNNNPSRFEGENRPVERVYWNLITEEFLPKLKKRTGKDYKLPSEVIWEFAARGGILSKGYKYSGSNDLNEVGWYIDNSHRESKPVGLKTPNELDLYDMNGNVLEWCLGYWQDNYDDAVNSDNNWIDVNIKNDKYRVIRGGSWFNFQHFCHPTYRSDDLSNDTYSNVGFRLFLSHNHK